MIELKTIYAIMVMGTTPVETCNANHQCHHPQEYMAQPQYYTQPQYYGRPPTRSPYYAPPKRLSIGIVSGAGWTGDQFKPLMFIGVGISYPIITL